MQQHGAYSSRHVWAKEGKKVTTKRPAKSLTPARAMTPTTTVTPTTAKMPAIAVTPEEAGTPAAANEFCGESLEWHKLIQPILSTS
jgi:hypothetical protein